MNKIIIVDIDNTICQTIDADYEKSIPIQENIDKINKLYDEGNTIIYWTSRGFTTGLDWFSLTEFQLNKWACKYHELKLDKPQYDLFIDDKSKRIEDI